jgi:hypothetical protein
MTTTRPSAALALTGLVVLAIAGCGGTTSTHPATVPASAATVPARAATVPASAAAVPARAAAVPASSVPWPVTSLHYAPNGNFGQSGEYLPGADGFNLADIDIPSKSRLDSLPTGLRGLVYLGDCGGATPSFQSAVDAFAGDPRLFGFYVMDEPQPRKCPAANLLAEDNWIHKHVPGAQAFAIVENLGTHIAPTYDGSYTPADSGLDLIGIDPYPVQSGLRSPDFGEIGRYVRAAEAHGWPQASIVPVYQAFGGGRYSYWVLPTAAQERQMLAAWAAVVPAPKFDYAYSWGPQQGDQALSQSPALQAVFAAKNAKASSP